MDAFEYEQMMNYSGEIGLQEPMRLVELIASHRRLREITKQTNAEWQAIVDEARKNIAAMVREEITHGEYIATARLRNMTISEFASFIAEPENN